MVIGSNKSPQSSFKSDSSSVPIVKKASNLSPRGSQETTSSNSSDESESSENGGGSRGASKSGKHHQQGSRGSTVSSTSSTTNLIPSGGGTRCEAPVKTKPKFRKYEFDDFQLVKVLGKGSFGKVRFLCLVQPFNVGALAYCQLVSII